MSLRRKDPLSTSSDEAAPDAEDYVLEGQVGFILRQASQRHATLFAARTDAGLHANLALVFGRRGLLVRIWACRVCGRGVRARRFLGCGDIDGA